MIFKSLGFTIEQGQPNPLVDHKKLMITEIEEELMLTEDGLNHMLTEDSNDPLAANIQYNMQVLLGVSRDGAETFGNNVSLNMNPTGKRKSRFVFQRLGRANDFTARLQFVGFKRFVVTDGVVEAYI
jgi:hypothetical protein